MQRSASISRHSSSASTRGVNTFVPPWRYVARVDQNVAMWNSGPQFRYTSPASISASRPIMSAWPTSAVVRQHRGVRPAGERRGVHQQNGLARIDVDVGGVGATGREQRLVLTVVVLHPARRRGRLRLLRARRAPCRRSRRPGAPRAQGRGRRERTPSRRPTAASSPRQKYAPSRAAASRHSSSRSEFWPSHTIRSPMPSPSRRRASASRSTRVSSSA